LTGKYSTKAIRVPEKKDLTKVWQIPDWKLPLSSIKNKEKNFKKGIDFIGKPRYNVKLYETL